MKMVGDDDSVRRVFVVRILCKRKIDCIVFIFTNVASNSHDFCTIRINWFPKEMNSLPRVHIPVDELI